MIMSITRTSALFLVLTTYLACDVKYVMGFWTIESMDVCELGLVVEENADGIPVGYNPPDFTTGIYFYDDNPSREGQPPEQYLPLTNTYNEEFEFRFSQKGNNYLFRHRQLDNSDVPITIVEILDDTVVSFFEHLWTYGNKNPGGLGCDCNNPLLDTPNDTPPVSFRVRTNKNSFLRSYVEEFRVCATWVEIPHDDDRKNESFILADEWACRDNDCDLLTDILSTGYHGFEVFSDYRCKLAELVNEQWMCCNCFSSYFRFTPPGSKCRTCQEYFGPNCGFCQESEGCAYCSSGYQMNEKTSECGFKWCSKQGDDHDGCCEEDDDTTLTLAASTPDTTTDCVVDTSCTGSGGGSTSSVDDDFVCNLAGLDEADWNDATNGRFRLGDVTDDCDDPYPPADNNYCISDDDEDGCDACECSNCDEETSGLVCNIAENVYWWYSNAMECVKCTRSDSTSIGFSNCQACSDGVGCIQCDEHYSLVYDHTYKVWYCELGPNDGTAAEYTPTGTTTWNGECFTECVITRGNQDYCACGCDCDDKEECQDSSLFDEFHCSNCEYDGGCIECDNDNDNNPSNDWFLISKKHKCSNCQDTFGDQCLFCNDYVGCGQCAEGYKATFDPCCQMVYCEAS